jgi:hypothetical protein
MDPPLFKLYVGPFVNVPPDVLYVKSFQTVAPDLYDNGFAASRHNTKPLVIKFGPDSLDMIDYIPIGGFGSVHSGPAKIVKISS